MRRKRKEELMNLQGLFMNLLYGIYILDTSSKEIKRDDYSVIYVKPTRRKKKGSDCK